MTNTLGICCTVAMVLYIWFDTNAFYEIMRKIFFFQKDSFEPYEKHLKATGVHVFFAEYLSVEDKFFHKLLSCPICVSVWICIFLSAALNQNIGLLFIFSNTVYFGFKKLILLFDE